VKVETAFAQGHADAVATVVERRVQAQPGWRRFALAITLALAFTFTFAGWLAGTGVPHSVQEASKEKNVITPMLRMDSPEGKLGRPETHLGAMLHHG
jgi:hypothetical protein